MSLKEQKSLIEKLGWLAKLFLSVVSSLFFLFALFSGATEPGLIGIVKNSPNAFPWLFLLGFAYLTWKKELLGGVLIVIFALFTVFAFGFYRPEMRGSLLIFSLPLLILGGLILLGSFKGSRK